MSEVYDKRMEDPEFVEYVKSIAPYLPRCVPKNADPYSEAKKARVKADLQDWVLHDEDGSNYKYYKHPFSKIKFGVIRMHFRDKSHIDVPRYEPESDDAGNSGYKMIKENGREKKVYLSELTYRYNEVGVVVKNSMEDFFQTRKGKRFLKYQAYMKKRYEKKRAYAQEAETKRTNKRTNTEQ
jgi:hypothetical protein|uniref:Uncharacterized protein n=1 Tax=viral metagenome TaxID=1070528 RepID=A0A6C0IQD3_9ZZZZ